MKQDQNKTTLQRFSMNCKVKQLNKDRSYVLYLIDDYLYIGESPQCQNPKYKIALQFETKCEWQFKNSSFLSFGIEHDGNIIWIYATDQDLKRLKQELGNKVMYINVADFYDIGPMIGQGSTSQVHLVVDKFSGKQFATKCILKSSLQDSKSQGLQCLISEIKMMQQLKHPKLIELNSIFEGNKNYHLILEYLEGKNLNHYIFQQNKGNLQYDDIRVIMAQLLEGINYIHQQGYIHRDVKPENIVFQKANDINTLKIVDLGLAVKSNLPKFPYPKCGTPGYVAPEIVLLKDNNQTYSNKCDIFSVGVICFRMFTKMDVFPGKNLEEIYQRNKSIQIDLSPMYKLNTPTIVQDFIFKMLEINPKQRMSAQDALNHEFFKVPNLYKSQKIDFTASFNSLFFSTTNQSASTFNMSFNQSLEQNKQLQAFLQKMEEEY